MANSKNFALIGSAGFIAPRHLKAIKDNHGNLLVSLDKNDVVGVMDSYFPNSMFFTEFERFEAYMSSLKEPSDKVDFVSICSPNYLHHSHMRFALSQDCNAICEKPLVLDVSQLDDLIELEKKSGKKVYTILQLRHHDVIIGLKQRSQLLSQKNKVDIDLTYITSRGNWYLSSWKNDTSKSGGIAMNIGIHFFDMLTWIFGKLQSNKVHLLENQKASGYLELEHARVRWYLSIDNQDIGKLGLPESQRTYRSIKIGNEELEFSEGFTELHTISYQNIINQKGFGLMDARESIAIASSIRDSTPIGLLGDYHPYLDKLMK